MASVPSKGRVRHLTVEQLKALLHKGQIRGAGLYEVGRKAIYVVDVPKEHPYYNRPWVMIGKGK